MKRHGHNLIYILFAGLLLGLMPGCRKALHCDDSAVHLPPPVPETRFRVIDDNGRDLLSANTPGHLSFDSLKAMQPCNISDALSKKRVQTGAGGLESFVFYFDGMRQPVTGENKECFTLVLDWGTGDTDTIEFLARAEHIPCGIVYYLDGVKFNGKDAPQDNNGNYLLQK